MTDIVERLRDAGLRDGFAVILHQHVIQAADEIERLRQGRETMENLWAREKEARCAAEAESARLRAALRTLWQDEGAWS